MATSNIITPLMTCNAFMWKVLEGLGLRTVVMEIQALPLLHWQKVPEGSWCPVAVSHIQGVYELVLLFLSPYLRPCNFAFRAFLVSSLHSLFLCVGGYASWLADLNSMRDQGFNLGHGSESAES